MISYKQWKLLNENFDTDAVLGLSRPANLGIAGEALGLSGMMYGKMKRMNGDVPPGLGKTDMGDMGDEDDMGDMGDEHDDMDHGDEDMGDEDMGDEEHGDMDHEDEEGEEDHPHDDTGKDIMPKKKKKPMVPPDMAAGGGPGVGSALGAGGPGVGAMDYMNYMKKEAHDDDDDDDDDDEEEPEEEDMGDEDMGDEDMGDEKPACCAKCGKMKKKSKKCCKMTKEDREFYESLRRQLGGVKFKQDQYGYWIPVKEDVLIPPAEQPAEDSPGPGEVGFAPQQKIGLVGSNFKEWASHHNRKVKKKRN